MKGDIRSNLKTDKKKKALGGKPPEPPPLGFFNSLVSYRIAFT